MTKAVFFDFYNTLARYEPAAEAIHVTVCRELGFETDLRTMRRALALADHYFYEENRRFSMAKRSRAEQNEVFLRHQELAMRHAGLDPDRNTVAAAMKRVHELARDITFALYEDVIPSLEGLRKRGLVLGLISNIPPEKLPVLDQLGIRHFLDVVAIPQEAGADKPDRAIFDLAVRRAGVKADEAVHVGDQYHIDAVGAMNAGLKAILLDRLDLFPQYNDCPRVTSLNQVADYL
ncbi:MAG: HAD-IA family hydrolase [Dehalococcoidia bacterium]|nr:HAD-IA family hydrolase [Dehalococcoidia bacterium]